MKTLFLIDGAAGTGKSDLIAYVARERKTTACFVPKYTTRPKRPDERDRRAALDLRFPPDTEARFVQRTTQSDFYWYQYGNERDGFYYYGLYRSDLRAALERYDSVLVIVRNFDTISAIKRDFADIRAVSIFIYTDRDLVTKRLKRDGYSGSEIRFRLGRLPTAWQDYLKYSTEYDEKLINTSDRRDFERLIDAMLQRYASEPEDVLRVSALDAFRLARPIVGFKRELLRRLSQYTYSRNVFLMMKFRGERNRRVYQFIKRTLAARGLNCVRADDDEWDITRNTYNPIAVLYCCRFGIALFDEPEPTAEYSPNVAYELGMMHQQGKDCLILRHSSLSTVPFDLAKDLYVDYRDNLELEEIITSWVSKIAAS